MFQDAAIGTTVYRNLNVTDVDFTNSQLLVKCDPNVTSAPQVIQTHHFVYFSHCLETKLYG